MPRRFTELPSRASKEAYKLVIGELAQNRAENAVLYVGASVVRDDYRQKISASAAAAVPAGPEAPS